MDCVLKYHFNIAKCQTYQLPTQFQNLTNYFSITRHCTMQEQVLQSVGYRPTRTYICLQTARCKVQHSTVARTHSQSSQPEHIRHFKT